MVDYATSSQKAPVFSHSPSDTSFDMVKNKVDMGYKLSSNYLFIESVLIMHSNHEFDPDLSKRANKLYKLLGSFKRSFFLPVSDENSYCGIFVNLLCLFLNHNNLFDDYSISVLCQTKVQLGKIDITITYNHQGTVFPIAVFECMKGSDLSVKRGQIINCVSQIIKFRDRTFSHLENGPAKMPIFSIILDVISLNYTMFAVVPHLTYDCLNIIDISQGIFDEFTLLKFRDLILNFISKHYNSGSLFIDYGNRFDNTLLRDEEKQVVKVFDYRPKFYSEFDPVILLADRRSTEIYEVLKFGKVIKCTDDLKILIYPLIPGEHIPSCVAALSSAFEVLNSLHTKSIVHGDVRLSNMVFNNNNCTLIDYDFSGDENKFYSSKFALKIPDGGRDPSIEPGKSKLTKCHDWYAMGCIMDLFDVGEEYNQIWKDLAVQAKTSFTYEKFMKEIRSLLSIPLKLIFVDGVKLNKINNLSSNHLTMTIS